LISKSTCSPTTGIEDDGHMQAARLIIGAILLLYGAVVVGCGVFETARGRRPPGYLLGRGVLPRGRLQRADSWTAEEWRHAGPKVAVVGAVVAFLGLLIIYGQPSNT
jgi:hypothetical protein